MPTHYVEDYDGKKNDDAVEVVVLSPVVDDPTTKRVDVDSVEDKAVKPAKTAAKKTAAKKS